MNKVSVQDLIRNYSEILKLKPNTVLRARKLCREAKDNFLLSGKKLEGSAAAIIYIAGILEDDRKSQREIAQVTSIPESTIRNRYLAIARGLMLCKD
jgi:transcription initiation factor TFIIB